MLTAADVMTPDVITVSPQTPVREIAALLHARRISGVPVVEGGRLVGIVSEGDLIGHAAAIGERRRSWWLSLFADERAMADDYAKTHGRVARDVMTGDVITVEETTSLAEIARLLERHRIKRVPVVRAGTLVGIVTRSNLLQALAARSVSTGLAPDDKVIRDRLNRELQDQPWARLGLKNIVVENGVVHLFGIADSEEERRALRVAAENVSGVVRVEDHLARGRYPVAE